MHCTDDRGTRPRYVQQWRSLVFSRIPRAIPRDGYLRISSDAQRSPLSWSQVVLWFTCFPAAILGASCVADSFSYPRTTVRDQPELELAACSAIVFAVWRLTRIKTSVLARIVVKHGYCPVCGYALREIPPADDGCTLCPECGSAWRIPAAKDE